MTQVELYSPQGLTEAQQEMLHAPLDATVIKDRSIGGGRRVKYIKGDTAIDTANRIFGFGQWGYKVVSRGHITADDPKKGKVEMYTADVELWVAGAAFTFPGGGCGIVNDPYTIEMHEKAYKEAETDAMKRALRHYGDQFGLCLYNEDDYVQLADGSLDQVKNVRPQQQQNAPRRFVDARQQTARIAQPTHPHSGTVEGHQTALSDADIAPLRNRWADVYGVPEDKIEEYWARYLFKNYKLNPPDVTRFHFKAIERDLNEYPGKHLASLKKRVEAISMDWASVKRDIEGVGNIPDGELTGIQRIAIGHLITQYERGTKPLAAQAS